MEECRNDKDTSFNFWKKLKGYQSHRFSLKLTRHDAKEWEKTSAFLLKKFQNEARQQKNFSFTKKFHFHTVLQSPLRKTKKQVGTPTNDRVDLFWAIFGLWHSNWVRINKARMAKPYWHGWTSERAPRGATRNRRIAFVQDFSNSFVYVFFSISLKSIIAFGTFFHCLEIEMHKSAQWIKISKKVSFT